MGKAVDLNGQWSSDWGAVELQVADGKVSGKWPEGTLAGTATDDGAVSLTWTHRDGTVGKGTLKASGDFKKLEGTWGFGDDDAGEGAWNMSQTRRNVPAPPPEPEPAPAPAPAPEPAKDEAPAAADDKKSGDKPPKK